MLLNPDSDQRYFWYEMSFFTYWSPTYCMTLCIGTPDDLELRLAAILSADSESVNVFDPFAMQVLLVDQVITIYDQSVWDIRDVIRKVEKV
jgi:hypothetical protein